MKILLCSYFKFPNGCAGAVRHEKLAQMLMELGHEVFVVGLGAANSFRTESHKSISYTSLRYGATSLPCKIGSRVLYWSNLKKLLDFYQPQVVIMDDMRPWVTVKLKKYSQKRNITLVHDSVEWYSKEQFKAGALALSYIQKNIVNGLLIDKSCRVIAISQYLMDHFSAKGIKCVNIPVVVSSEDLVNEKELQPVIRFVYAGQAGRKDYLNVILGAMSMMTKEERKLFEFHILGCKKEQLLNSGIAPSVLQSVEDSIVIHGRVKREEVLDLLKTADFTILMRSAEHRYAKAGFPTKAVESLSHSTPIIANLTSDLHRYLVDGVNSLIVEDCSPEALVKTLRRAIDLSMEEREQMCRNAYDTAAEKLHYKHFISEIEEILK